MIVFAIETGLRKSEQIGLVRSQVNLVKREVTLGRETKAGRGRVVPLSQRALSVLEGQLPDDPREVVFRNLQGRGWVTIETWWDKVRNRSGIFCRWHDLRHTFASRWLQDGGEITVLQKVLGHSTLELTMRYAHLVTENLHAETRRLDEVRRLRRLDAA
jgi:integrase/recombinase XerD